MYRSKLSIDLIEWIPMAHQERSYCIRWQPWLAVWRETTTMSRCLSCMLNRSRIIECCQTHQLLCLPFSNLNPLLFLLNKPPTSLRVFLKYADSWRFYWPTIYSILSEIDQLQHGYFPPGNQLFGWTFPALV